jgi:hypothetical protein
MYPGPGGGHRPTLILSYASRHNSRTGPDRGRPRRSDSGLRRPTGKPGGTYGGTEFSKAFNTEAEREPRRATEAMCLLRQLRDIRGPVNSIAFALVPAGETCLIRGAASKASKVLTQSLQSRSLSHRATQRSRWPQPKMWRTAGRHRAYACGALCLAPPQSCVARQSKQDSTQMNANKPR